MKKLGAGLLLSFLLLGLALRSQGPAQAQPDPEMRVSSFFTDPSGCRALFLVLQKVLGAERVRQHRLPFTALDSSIDTLILARPPRGPSSSELEALDHWLREGGQLLLASSDGWKFDPESKSLLERYGLQLDGNLDPPELLTLSQGWQVRCSRGASWSGVGQPHSSTAQGQPLVWQIELAEGRLLALWDPLALSNQALAESDNAYWILQLLGEDPGVVAFDEYHQGFGERRSFWQLLALFLATPWGWCCLQAGAALLVYLLHRQRLGQAIQPWQKATPLNQPLWRLRSSLLQHARAQALAQQQILLALCQQLGSGAGRALELPEVAARLQRLGRQDLAEALLSPRPKNPLAIARLAWEIRKEMGNASH